MSTNNYEDYQNLKVDFEKEEISTVGQKSRIKKTDRKYQDYKLYRVDPKTGENIPFW